jgi:hypothetical protein
VTRRGRMGSITDDGEICKHLLCFLSYDCSTAAYILLSVLHPAFSFGEDTHFKLRLSELK